MREWLTKKQASKGINGKPFLLQRPSLLRSLDGALNVSLTYVQAPAGYGKTVLVRQWASRLNVPSAFIDAQGQPEGQGVAELATRGILKALGEDGREGLGLAALSETSFRRAEDEPGDIVVVVDDLPVNKSTFSRAELQAFERMPDNVHVVVTSRCRPKGVSELRLNGLLSEIPPERLALSTLETDEVVNAFGVEADPGRLRLVERLVGGWPAGVRMACMAAERSSSAPDETFLRILSGMVEDYVEDEVFTRLSDDASSAVRVVAILEECTEGLMATALGWSPSRASQALRSAFDEGAFLSTREESSGRVFIIHPLIGSAVARSASPTVEHRTVARACDGLKDEGEPERAVELLARFEDWDGIAGIVIDEWQSMLAESKTAQLLRWVEAIPRPYVLSHPELAMVEMLPRAVHGQLVELYEDLRAAFPTDDEADAERSRSYWALRCVALATVGDAQPAYEAGRRALLLLPRSEEYFRSMVEQSLAGMDALQDPVSARGAFQKSGPLLLRAGMRNPACSAYSNAARICAYAGLDDEALEAAASARKVAGGQKSMRSAFVQAVLAEAVVAYDHDDTKKCDTAVSWILGIKDSYSVPEHIAAALVLRALIADRTGDAAASRRAAAKAADASPVGVVRAFPPLGLLSAWAQDDILPIGRASSLLDRLAQASPFAAVLSMSAHLAQGDADDGLSSKAVRVAERVAKAPRYQIRALLVASLSYERTGQRALAESTLFKALEVARENRLEGAVVDEHELLEVWHRLVRRLGPNSWASRLYLRARRHVPPSPITRPASSLTERELDVMRLAANGLTVKGIADELFVSHDTVKKHLSNVYQKLGVHSKLQAVAVLHNRGVI